MSDTSAYDRLVTDWLRSEAPGRAPEGVLATAMDRVAELGQERPFGGRRFDAWISRSPRLHWAVIAALLAVLSLGAVLGAGALLRDTAPPSSGVANGWIAVSANQFVGGGEWGDIYILGTGTGARRIVGSDGDGVAQACPRFSPDGRRLAYGEGRQALQPDDNPLRGRASVANRAIVLVALDDTGNASAPIVRVTPSPEPGEMLCPQWSPTGDRVAFRDGLELWVAEAASGTVSQFRVTAAPRGQQGLAWSRDGSRIAVAEPGRIRVVSLGDGGSTVIPVTGATPGSLGWTAGDASIVYRSTDEAGDGLEVHTVEVSSLADTRLALGPADPQTTAAPGAGGLVRDAAWVAGAGLSPDGSRLAVGYVPVDCTSDGCATGPHRLVTMDPDGSDALEVPIPAELGTDGLQWSPDGTRVLLSAIDGLVSVSVVPALAPIVHSSGELDLEWSRTEFTWQSLFP